MPSIEDFLAEKSKKQLSAKSVKSWDLEPQRKISEAEHRRRPGRGLDSFQIEVAKKATLTKSSESNTAGSDQASEAELVIDSSTQTDQGTTRVQNDSDQSTRVQKHSDQGTTRVQKK